ncbi:MAG: flagellar basal body-associated protein FliL [Lachnospiraceae bacterium]|nr:flagellar basal body-associated protein FliL [Lachnospiraceae bacterium]
MKKNLISVGILALIIVNCVLTGIMMFSVISTNKKTAALVSDIATAINLELEDASVAESEPKKQLSIADIASATISDMNIPLKSNGDGKAHMGVVSVTFSLDTTHEDYKTYGATFLDNEDLIKGKIIEIVSAYTIDEANDKKPEMCSKILSAVQTLFGSEFVFDVSFSYAYFQ